MYMESPILDPHHGCDFLDGLPENDGGDRLRRVVHLLLAVYLAPVVLLVLLLGAVLTAVLGVVNLASWVSKTLVRFGNRRNRAAVSPRHYPGLTAVALENRGGRSPHPRSSRGERVSRPDVDLRN